MLSTYSCPGVDIVDEARGSPDHRVACDSCSLCITVCFTQSHHFGGSGYGQYKKLVRFVSWNFCQDRISHLIELAARFLIGLYRSTVLLPLPLGQEPISAVRHYRQQRTYCGQVSAALCVFLAQGPREYRDCQPCIVAAARRRTRTDYTECDSITMPIRVP